MEDKKDEATVLNTDIEQPQKEENNKEQKQEDKKSSKKAISIFIAVDILIIIIIVLLLCLKNCKPTPNIDNGEQPLDTERVNKITDVFRGIVRKNMEFNSYPSDNLDKVIAVSYKDNYPTNFSLEITIASESKIYYCPVSNYSYDGDKEQYNDFISYLLLDTTAYSVGHGTPYLNVNKKTDIKINTDKSINRYVINESDSEPKDNFFFGFYKENDNFYVYQNKSYVDGSDPFTSNSDQTITSDSPLYDYYRGLLIA